MVRDTPPSQDVSTHQIWNSYLKESRRYGPDTKAGRTHGRTDSAITICLPKFLWGHKKIKTYIYIISKSDLSTQICVCKFKVLPHFFHFNLICNMTTFRKKQEMSQSRDECPKRNWSSIRHIRGKLAVI